MSFLLLFSTFLFFFTDTPSPSIYTLSLHDALPISDPAAEEIRPLISAAGWHRAAVLRTPGRTSCAWHRDRKSTRLNSSHRCISYAVFCLKKKNILGFDATDYFTIKHRRTTYHMCHA